MEPQLYRCGNDCTVKTRYTDLLLSRSFNGAATLSLRKSGRATTPQEEAPLFVLQWSRNFIVAEIVGETLGFYRAPMLMTLQWSRNFIVAEITDQSLNQYNDSCKHASMEPQLYRCGNLGYKFRGHDNMPPLLQWSRNFIVAEIDLGVRRVGQLVNCFNGAATLSLRKSEIVRVR